MAEFCGKKGDLFPDDETIQTSDIRDLDELPILGDEILSDEVEKMSFKEFFIDRTKQYFRPLKYKSTWIICIIGAFILMWLEHG